MNSRHEMAVAKRLFIRAHDIEALIVSEKFYEANGIGNCVYYWALDVIPAMRDNLPIPDPFILQHWLDVASKCNKSEITSLINDMIEIDKVLQRPAFIEIKLAEREK